MIAHRTGLVNNNRMKIDHEIVMMLDRVFIDNGQRIGDTVVTVEVDRNHAMENTMLQIKFVDEFADVPLGRNGRYGRMQVELSRFNSSVNDHIYGYGLRQILNDAMADKTDDEGNQLPTDQIVAKAQKRLDALYAGDLRIRRAGDAEPADPVEAEIARSVKAIMHNVYTEIGAYKSVPKGTKNRLLWVANARRAQKNLEPFETLQEVIGAYMSKSPKAAAIRKEAERTVKMRADAGDDLI